MRYVKFPKSLLRDFQQSLIDRNNLIAPVIKGEHSYSFQKVSSAEEISETYLPTLLPPKKFYMPQHETLLTFDTSQGQDMQASVDVEPLILYGVRTCDIAGIQCLNLVFSNHPKDLHYLTRKKFIRIIGVECGSPCDQFSSCGLMGNHTPNGGYDLFLTEIEDEIFIHINTYEGEELLKNIDFITEASHSDMEKIKKYRLDKQTRFTPEPDVDLKSIPQIFKSNTHSKIWDEIGEKCLSCANCTNVCPTCYCFDVEDEIDLNMTTGRRIRVWDSCQNESFARVAGGENFRKDRKDRQRHRFHRKFVFPHDRFGRFFCTGCGRCNRTCMSGINMKNTLNALSIEGGKND